MCNLTAGTGDPYWYEWSVGLLYMVKMLNSDNGIKNVVLQSEKSQSLDDVVVTYEDGRVEYIQVKHTREEDKLSFSDMIEGDVEKSYLYKYSSEWKKMETKNSGKNKVVFFTNREMGNHKHTPEPGKERPPLKTFWKNIKEQVENLTQASDENVDINNIVVEEKWKIAWDVWKKSMSTLTAKEQLMFLKNFDLMTDQEDLEEMISSIAVELEKKFKTTHEKAVNLHQKLCYQLIWWATSICRKKDIEREDVMDALSICGDSVKGNHLFPVCEPFFQSRVTFVQKLEDTILSGKSKVIFLTGNPGCGKTNIVSYLSCKPESIVTLRFHAFKPIIPGDVYVSADLGISNPMDFWGDLLIMLRGLFKGRLYEYDVPVSIELIDSIDVLRTEVLRLASAWADIIRQPVVIAVDGIDHAARSGNKNTFLRTLPSPEAVPDNVRFLLAGQPTYQFSEYPDFLSDADVIEEVNVPNIEKEDLKLLYEKNSSSMKYSEHEKALVIDYIAEIAKGNTLSAVFATQEATQYSNFTDFEMGSNVKKLALGIQSYYEYIWKTAIQQVTNIGYTVDMHLAAIFSVINKRVMAQSMVDIYAEGIPLWQWEDILQNLFPIVTYNSLGYGVFHNDVRVFLNSHYKKARQFHPIISGKIANYLLNYDFDEKVKHEVVFKLLKEAGQEEKYVDVFTCEYVMKAYLLKRDIREVQQQMLSTLETLPQLVDKRKIVKFSCAITTMQQHGESLRWLDREYQSNIEIPFALDSEKSPVIDKLLSIEQFERVFADIDVLVAKNEINRAKHILLRWMDKKIPGKLFVAIGEKCEKDRIGKLLETWGKYARMFKIVPEKIYYEEKVEGNMAAYFYGGWIKEAINYVDTNELEYTLENISCYFDADMEAFLQAVIKYGQPEETTFLLKEKLKKAFSRRNIISVCAWAIKNSKEELCEEWIQEISDKNFEYISEKWYEHKYTELDEKKERFKMIVDIMYILSYVSKEKIDVLKEKALKKAEFKTDRGDNVVAGNLLVAVNQIAYMEQCILQDRVEKISIEDFNVLLEIILNERYYNRCFGINTIAYRKRILISIIQMTEYLPTDLQILLKKRLCEKAETYSEIALLESYWEFLVKNGKINVIEKFYDTWMCPDGLIWIEELSERDYISSTLLKIAEKMNWEERIRKSLDLLNARSIGYVGRKDYSLLNPLQWFERIAEDKNVVWKKHGIQLLNISEYASKIGDNRAYVQIANSVSGAAARMGIDSFAQFAQMVKTIKRDWEEVVFDGIISALENGFFTEDDLMQLWGKTIYYFHIDESAKSYDSSNIRNKIYCSDVHEAISLCSYRLGYSEVEKHMEQIAPLEYGQRRLDRSEHSCIIPKRWYESEYHENMLQFIDVTKEMNCDEMLECIKEQYKQNGFSWDYIKCFVQTVQKSKQKSVNEYKTQILDMLKERELNTLDYDGINRLYDVLFLYMTQDEIAEVLNQILETYYHHRDEGWTSAEYGLMTDLENFTYALFSRFNSEENEWALQEILQMHCMWLNGTDHWEMENIYQIGEENHINGWKDFWNQIEMGECKAESYMQI